MKIIKTINWSNNSRLQGLLTLDLGYKKGKHSTTQYLLWFKTEERFPVRFQTFIRIRRAMNEGL